MTFPPGTGWTYTKFVEGLTITGYSQISGLDSKRNPNIPNLNLR
jgi:hypothetical protein